MAFTYDKALSSARDKVRFFITDTDPNNYAFEDEEIDGLLTLYPDSFFYAAAAALDFSATDVAKVAVITKNDNQTTDPTKMASLLAERAENLRKQAGTDPTLLAALVSAAQDAAPDRVFTTTHRPDEIGTMEGW